VPEKLAPTYEKAFSVYGHYRPWRQGVLANIERTYAMVARRARHPSIVGRRQGLDPPWALAGALVLSVWTRRMSGTSGRIARKTTEISQKSSA